MNKLFLTILLTGSLLSSNAQDINYYNKIEQWHKMRIENLKKSDGWLNLEGLFWLHKGNNSFGSSKASDCFYDHQLFPPQLGNFKYEGDSVVWENGNDYTISINKKITKPNTSYTIFKNNKSAAILDWKQFSWVVIKREDKVGIRFRNLKAATLLTFKGIDRFAVDTTWRIKAKLIQPTQDFLMITNVLGQTTASKNAGQLVFEKNGASYTLDVLDEGGDELFIVFADKTSGVNTYGAGRFIEIPKPDAAGNTIIDFNKAYNPPCAFTAFATCPLPPKQNRLTLLIEAGEKNYGHH